MKLEALRTEVRELLATFATEVGMSSAMGDTSISSASELFLLEVLRDVFREAMDLPGLRYLNAERRNFPGVDLGDDQKGVAFQVTADPSLDKIVETLKAVIAADLHATYPHVRVYVTTKKQRSYKQASIDQVTNGRLQFDATKDVLDFEDLAELLGSFELDPLQKVVDILRKHLRPGGVPGYDQHVNEVRERDLARRYQEALQRSNFPENNANDEFRALAQEVLTELGAGVSAALRRRVLLRASRSAAIGQRLEAAERLFSAATNLVGPDSALPARARIAEAQGDADGAIRLLRDERDADAVSTLLSVIARAKGDDAAVVWVADQHLDARHLTSNGVIALSQVYLRRADFDSLVSLLDSASDAQLTESPYLVFLRGMVRVVTVFPKPDRMTTLGGIPLDVSFARPILLPGELAARLDAAIADLQRVLPIARQLKLPETARTAQSYRTWSSLLHPYRREAALVQLRADMQEPSKAMHLVQFAFYFEDAFDPGPLEDWLTKRESLGGLDDQEARAALVIQMHSGKPERIAEVVAKHRARLQRALGEPVVLIIEVQALALAKDATSARVQLNAGKDLLDSSLVARLEVEIAKAEGADPVVEHLRVYKDTRTTEALRALVRALMLKKDHRALGKYAEELYAATGDPHDIAVAAQAYANAGEHEDFVRVIEAFAFLKEQEVSLKRRYGWQLLQLGRMKEAKQITEELRAANAGERDLDLEIAVAIETGQWEMLALPLTAYLSDETHSGLTLIRAAHLAQSSGQGPFQELMEAAHRKGGNDVEVLLGSYVVAIEGGLEEEHPQAHEWFRRALELSGPNGPIQQFELKEILARQLEWNAQSRKIDEAIIRGDLPLIVAAPALHTTMVELLLGNFVRNTSLADPRKRSVVPLFSGRRVPAPVGDVRRIALDITAVMVLGWLGILPKVFEAFTEIVLPAGLLYELFEGRQRIRQFQKSRIVRAKQIRELIAGRLNVVPEPDTPADELARQIGADLAVLLRAAKTSGGIVVRPTPVLRVGVEDAGEVDLSAHAVRLTDMQALLKVLVELGAVDQPTEEFAERYFAVQDKGWPAPASPEKTRPLYLDDLAVSYLQTTHLLEAVVQTFDEVYVASSTEENAVALIDLERRSDEVLRTIDTIREVLAKAAQVNRIIFGPRRASGEPGDIRDASTMHLLADTLGADAIVIDDRALNKELFATDGKKRQPRAITSLDVIEDLQARGFTTDAQRAALRSRLRRAGAALMPVDAEEIRHAVQRTGQYESVEFRAIRESIGLARIREAPRFPAEVPWFVTLNLATKSAILEIWKHETDMERAAVLSDAVLDAQPKPVDWVALWPQEAPEGWVEAVVRVTTASLALPVELLDRTVREAYHRWLDSRMLEPMRVNAPARYAAVINHVKSFVIRHASDDNG